MKRIIAIFVAVVTAFASLYAADKKADIAFEEKDYDFGTVSNKHEPITHEYTFTNISDKPIIIFSASASCGCTQPKYTHEPVKPGEKGVVTVTFEPKKQYGYVKKYIKVKYISKGKKKNISLSISGSVFRSE